MPVMTAAVAQIDLAAYRRNLALLSSLGSELLVVVKANGYGHGMVPMAAAARQAGVRWLGVAQLDEALALRAAGDTGSILCWLTNENSDFAAGITADVELTAYSVAELAQIVSTAQKLQRQPAVQLKFDSGLSRGGARNEDWLELVTQANKAERAKLIKVTGVWSHLACADEPEHPENFSQEAKFRQALQVATNAGLQPKWQHLANSAAALALPSARFNLLRCGIASYGLSPIIDQNFDLTPVMTLKSRLLLTKKLASGESVSYGHHFTADREMQLGLVPLGYGDGILRSTSNLAEVQVNGVRCRILGRVCMDQFLVDVTAANAKTGDEVILFGPGKSGEPTATDWAMHGGTINYEIVTQLGGRITWEYHG